MHRNSDCVRWDPATVMYRRKSASCATWFPEEVRTMEEFMQALKKGGMKPAYYEDGCIPHTGGTRVWEWLPGGRILRIDVFRLLYNLYIYLFHK